MFKHLVIALALIGGVGLATPQDAEAGPRARRGDRPPRNRSVRDRGHIRVAPRVRERVRQRRRARIRRAVIRRSVRRSLAAHRFLARRVVFGFDRCRYGR